MRPSPREGLLEDAYGLGFLLSDAEHHRLARCLPEVRLWLGERHGPDGADWNLHAGALETAFHCDDPAVALAFAGRWLADGPRPGALWRMAEAADLPAIDTIGDAAHPTLPEAPGTFAEKLRLFPDGFLALVDGAGAVQGYGIAHPWRFGRVPPLDALLGGLPEKPDCLWLHDCVIREPFRGAGHIGGFVAHATDIARAAGLRAMSAVSVYGSHRLLERYGFRIVEAGHPGALAGYGDTARHVVARLPRM